MDLRFVMLPEIDLDNGTFEIREFAGTTRLRESLARSGILDPPWLQKKGGEYIVIDGFKRLRWAKENGVQGAECRIFPEHYETGELWKRRLEKKIFEREINPAEKAQIVSTLLELFQPWEIPRFFLTELDVSNRPEVLQNWALLSTWGPESLLIIASGAVAERAALEIAGWDRGSRDSILRVLLVLRCSASIQVEIVERISEIAIREEKVGADIIDTPRVREILETTGLNHRQKTQALRELLSELRYPRLSLRQRRFKRESEAVGLPKGTRIIPPAAFEGNNWRMELSFSDVQELLKMLDLTMSIAQSGRLDAILGVKGEG